jgi:hypothetical protein
MRAPPQPPGALASVPLSRWMLLGGTATILLLVFHYYWPLTRFFFSQDDFYFLEKASHGFRASMEQHFNTRPGHFRPLTKGLYFLVMWPLFGMNPVPYHVASLLLHATNSILAGAVLRRLGVSTVMSWAAALLFAANVTNLEAVAWISCVQQLMGATFAFIALIWGVDALSTKSRTPLIGATIAYLLALGSYEQTMSVPLVLMAWQWSTRGWRAMLRACSGPLLPMLLLLFVYCVYALGVRGIPHTGPYEMWMGGNVLNNVRQYSGSVFAFWLIYPYFDLPVGFRGSHIVWCALIAWFVFRGKQRQLAFGCSAFLLFLAPVLFIQYHVFSFHLYIPAIGASYLLAAAADSLVEALAIPWRRYVRATAMCAMVLVAAGSTVAVRKNLTNYCSDDVKIPKLRVLRRAVLAEEICSGVAQHWPGGSRLALVYAGDPGMGNWGNIQSAISDGIALRLVLHQPTLEVVFLLPSEGRDVPEDQVMIVTELGRTFTFPQYQTVRSHYP